MLSFIMWYLLIFPALKDAIYSTHIHVNAHNTKNNDVVVLSTIYPTRGSELGGTKVTIRGSGFESREFFLFCCFNESQVTAQLVSDEEIFCYSPSSPPGNVSVTLCNEDDQDWLIYEYIIMATIFTVTPSSGSGGNEVDIIGSGFVNSSDLSCRFNSVATPATFVTSSKIKCVAPVLDAVPSEPYLVTVSNNRVDIEGDWASMRFYYTARPVVTSLDPITAPCNGGTSLFIRGTNFPTNDTGYLVCKIGDVLVNGIGLSADEIVCVLPQFNITGPVALPVSVSINGGHEFNLEMQPRILVHPPTKVIAAIPSSAPDTGLAVISVFGTGFYRSPHLGCQFGNATVSATWISESLIHCEAPSMPRGDILLGVTTNGQNVGLSSNTVVFTFTHTATLTSISPSSGPFTGGTIVYLYGTGFVPSSTLLCRFGSNSVQASHIFNQTTAKCIVPSASTKVMKKLSVDISVNNGYHFTCSGIYFMYKSHYQITSVSPTLGPSAGNTRLILNGHFPEVDSINLKCLFSVGQFQYRSNIFGVFNNSISCLTPSVKLGYHNSPVISQVYLVYDDGDSDLFYMTETGSSFEFYGGAYLHSIHPKYGSELGGTNVTITGRFPRSRHIVCKFDELLSPFALWVSKDTIVCTSPPATERFLVSPVVNVTVLINGEDDESLRLPFQYLIASHVSSVTPTFGSKLGGTLVLIDGAGFPLLPQINVVCSFGGVASEAKVLSTSKASCRSPKSNFTNTVPLRLSVNNDYEESLSYTNFTYVDEVILREIRPAIVSSTNSSLISLIGENFSPQLSSGFALCLFGGSKLAARVVNDNLITFWSPVYQNMVVSQVKVSLNTVDFSTNGPVLSVLPPPTISDVSPNFSNEHGGIPISITGSGFYNVPNLSCIFKFDEANDIVVRAKYGSLSNTICSTPAVSKVYQQVVSLELSITGVTSENNPSVKITYFIGVSISSIYPLYCPKSGCSSLAIKGSGFNQQRRSYFCQIEELDYPKRYVPAEYSSDALIHCKIPASQNQLNISTAFLSIMVLKNERFYHAGGEGKNVVSLDFIDDIVLKEVIPNYAFTTVRTVVQIKGNHFLKSKDICCAFIVEGGKYVSSAMFISSDLISCPVPEIPATKSRTETITYLKVSNNGVDLSNNGLAFHHRQKPILERVEPMQFSDKGNTILTITMDNVFPDISPSCLFRNKNGIEVITKATSLMKRYISCSSPNAAPGEYLLTIILSGTLSTNGIEVEIYDRISIHDFSPSQGPFCGGDEILITGQNFPNTTSLQCKFGQLSTKALFLSSREIKCISPRQYFNQSMDVEISVSGNGHDDFKTHFTKRFRYEDDLIHRLVTTTRDYDFDSNGDTNNTLMLYRIKPSSGSIDGMYRISLTGTGFYSHPNAACRFGITIVPAVIISFDTIECKVPKALYPGDVSVDVTVNGSQWTDCGINFVYVLPLEIYDVHPRQLPMNGGTVVHVSASKIDLTQTIYCMYGTIGMVQAVVISRTSLTCVAPATSISGSFSLDILIEGVSSLLSQSITMKYVKQSSFVIHPNFGPKEGNKPLQIKFKETAFDFVSHSFECVFMFKNNATRYSSLKEESEKNSTIFSCLTPNIEDMILLNDEDFVLANVNVVHIDGRYSLSHHFYPSFTFKSLPSNIIVTPRSGDSNGGTIVTLRTLSSGEWWMNSNSLSCKFGSISVHGLWISKHVIQCNTPPSIQMDTNVTIAVTENGVDYVHTGYFYYQNRASITSVDKHIFFENTHTDIVIATQNLVMYDHPTCMFQTEDKNHNYIIVEATVLNNTALRCRYSPRDLRKKIYLRVSSNGYEYSHSFFILGVVPMPRLTMLHPRSGISSQINQIIMEGENFVKGNTVWKCVMTGNTYKFVTAADRISEYMIKCDLKCPTVHVPERFQLTLMADDTETSKQLFWCNPLPNITNISPSIVFTELEQNVTVNGNGFAPSHFLKCILFGDFGRLELISDFIDESMFQCTIPQIISPQVIELDVMIDGKRSIYQNLELSVLSHPYITEVRYQIIVAGSAIEMKGFFGGITDVFNCRIGKFKGRFIKIIDEHTIECYSLYELTSGIYTGVELFSKTITIKSPTSAQIKVIDQPSIHQIYPHKAIRFYNTPIAVSGNNFNGSNGICQFGNITSKAKIHSNNKLSCDAPPSEEDSKVLFMISIDGIPSLNEVTFEYVQPWIVQNIVPTSGSIHGGTKVSIFGTNFDTSNRVECQFGKMMSVLARVVSNDSVQCIAPKVEFPQYVQISLVFHGSSDIISIPRDGSDHLHGFYYYDEGNPVEEEAILEKRWLKIRNVIIQGSWYYDKQYEHLLNPKCMFDKLEVLATLNSPKKLLCGEPAGISEALNVTLQVSLNGIEYLHGFVPYHEDISSHKLSQRNGLAQMIGTPIDGVGYLPVSPTDENDDTDFQVLPTRLTLEITLSHISPILGTSSGGTTITVYGQGFGPSNDVLCWFGEYATIASYISSASVECNSSAYFLGHKHTQRVAFSISQQKSDSYISKNTYFYYYNNLAFDDIVLLPWSGPLSGGTKVQIKGQGITNVLKQLKDVITQDDTKVYINGKISDALIRSDFLEFFTKPQPLDLSDISVSFSLNGGRDIVLCPHFVFYNTPVLLNVNPQTIINGFHSELLIEGTGFPTNHHDVMCQIGGHKVRGHWKSTSMVMCNLPTSHNMEKLSFVSISFNNQDFISEALPIFISSTPVVIDIDPLYFRASGGTQVIIKGSNFDALKQARCSICLARTNPFMKECSRMFSISDTELHFTAPQGDGSNIEIQFGCGTKFTSASTIKVSYIPNLFLHSSVCLGNQDEGYSIHLQGSNFIEESSYSCIIKPIHSKGKQGLLANTNAIVVNTTSLTCLLPPTSSHIEKIVEGKFMVQVKRHIDSSITNAINPYFERYRVEPSSYFDPIKPVELNENSTLEAHSRFDRRSSAMLKPFDTKVETIKPSFEYSNTTNKSPLLLETKSDLRNYYHPPPVIHSIGPLEGSFNGGSALQLIGVGLKNSNYMIECIFGHKKIDGIILNDNLVECIIPQVYDLFEFLHINTKTSLNVTFKVSIYPRLPSVDILATNKSFDKPPFFYGGITNTILLSTMEFIYEDIPKITSVTPNLLPSNGNEIIRVIGQGFKDTPGLSCQVGNAKPRIAIFINKHMLECKIPNLSEAIGQNNDQIHIIENHQMKVHLSILNYVNGFHPLKSPKLKSSFSYYEHPTFIDSTPQYGTTGTSIHVVGQSFPKVDDPRCQFGVIVVEAEIVDSSNLVCIVPDMQQSSLLMRSVDIGISLNGGVHFIETGFKFHFIQSPIVKQIVPSTGPDIGGNIVSVFGSNFELCNKTIMCQFGDSFAHSNILSDHELQCLAPPKKAGLVKFHLLEVDQKSASIGLFEPPKGPPKGKQYHDNEISYTYVQNFAIEKVVPNFGYQYKNMSVTILGNNFQSIEGLVCIFGNDIGNATFISSREIICTLYYNSEDAPSTIKIHLGIFMADIGLTFLSTSKNAPSFTYIDVPSITSVIPPRGLFLGGDKVIVNGQNFTQPIENKIICAFGENKTFGEWLSPSQIVCLTPSMPSCTLCELKLSLNHNDYFGGTNGSQITFTFDKHIVVTKISPSHGSIRGGTPVTLSGEGFFHKSTYIGKLFCVFGITKYVEASFTSNHKVKCNTPLFPAPAKVIVSLELFSDVEGSGTTIESMAEFEFVHEPKISTTFPSILPVPQKMKWDILEVFGYNFRDSMDLGCLFIYKDVYFNEDSVSSFKIKTDAIFYNTTYIQCLGNFDKNDLFHWKDMTTLYISTNGEDLSNGYEIDIVKTHLVSSLFPLSGPNRGGTEIMIHGQNFIETRSLSCRFGNIYLVPAIFYSSHAIKCVAPQFIDTQSISKNVTVDVTNNGYHFTSNSFKFHYYDDIHILSIDPKGGPSVGGTIVKIQLSYHSINSSFDSSSYTCKFNETHVQAKIVDTISAYDIMCRSPPSYAHGGLVSLEVSLNGVDFSATGNNFLYSPGHQRHSLVLIPSHGPVTGGTLVRVKGSLNVIHHGYGEELVGNDIANTAACKFGEYVTTAEKINKTEDSLYCRSPDFSHNDNHTEITLEVSLSGEYEDFTNFGLIFQYDKLITVAEIYPDTGSYNGGTSVQIYGGPFLNLISSELLCKFGQVVVNASWHSKHVISCVVPPVSMQTLDKIESCPVSISINGFDFSSATKIFKYRPNIIVERLIPNHGYAQSSIIVKGSNFSPSNKYLCHFGLSQQKTTRSMFHRNGIPIAGYLNSTHVVCLVPPGLSYGHVSFFISIDGTETDSDKHTVLFHHDEPLIISKVFPAAGPNDGNFRVTVYGGEFDPVYHESYKCKFGSYIVTGSYISRNQISCIAPSLAPGIYFLRISHNEQDFSDNFEPIHFYKPIHVEKIIPLSGPAKFAGSRVQFVGTNFMNSSSAVCKFHETLVPAKFISKQEIVCFTPALFSHDELSWEKLSNQTHKEHSIIFPQAHDYPLYLSRSVKVEVSMNGQDFSNSGLRFLYQNDIYIDYLITTEGHVKGGTPILIIGSGFVNNTLLSCRFGHHIITATFLARNLILCFSPPQSMTYADTSTQDTVRKRSIFSDGPSIDKFDVFIEVSNNGFDFTDFKKIFKYITRINEGYYQPGFEESTMLLCPKGAYCKENMFNSNFTLCEKGTFNPLVGQITCTRCKIGFICPEAGLIVPRICPAGYVCDVTGLEVAVTPCPSGFYCEAGTVTSSTYCGQYEDINKNDELSTSLNNPFLIGGRHSFCWDNSTEDYGLQMSSKPSVYWNDVHRLPLDDNAINLPLRGRYCQDDSCMIIQKTFDLNIEASFHLRYTQLQPQTPRPCTKGSYCNPGSSSINDSRQCDGKSYCPEATTSPGEFDCPKGFYCRFGKRYQCPIGTYCPVSSMWDPLPCEPGFFNAMVGQVKCTLCPIGTFCSGFGRIEPSLCTPGYVCSKVGLSSPNLKCTAGFYCGIGTQTSDPFRNDTSLRPYPCKPGSFCLPGVGFPDIVEGNFSHAQPCTNGFYCEAASTSAKGSGLCPPGFICEKGTATPKPTPKGTYAKLQGMSRASSCLVGFYAPTIESVECIPCPPGTECEQEGMDTAEICGPGSFRSTMEVDGVTCQSCPPGTWSKNWQLRDEVECNFCPMGLKCDVDGMTSPCSKHDLPTPYEPVLNLNGIPVLEYKYSTRDAPPPFSIDECLQLNEPQDKIIHNKVQFFFGELVPPYIDILGRGAHIRIVDEASTKYNPRARCYRNTQPSGSLIYQRMAMYYGPQYDIQRGYPNQRYSRSIINEQDPMMTMATLNMDHLYSTLYNPSLNCTHGFNLMNSSLVSNSKEIVFTNEAYDYEGGIDVQKCSEYDEIHQCFIDTSYELHEPGQCCNIAPKIQRAIYLADDQYYPGTCEADIICKDDNYTMAEPCQDGFVCPEKSTSQSSSEMLCAPGFVCKFGTTPDSFLDTPNGQSQYANLCPHGLYCNNGTGISINNNQCPQNYFCPSGTADPYLGQMANDGLKRYLKGDMIDPGIGNKNVLYFGGDNFQLISNQETKCLSGLDNSLDNRFLRLVHSEVMDNFIATINNVDPVSTLLNKDNTIVRTIKHSTKYLNGCARDNKWNLINDAIGMGGCDCNSQLLLIIAVFRLWQCTMEIRCSWSLSETINATSGKIPLDREIIGYGSQRKSIPMTSEGLLNLHNFGTSSDPDFQFLVQFNETHKKSFKTFWDLKNEVSYGYKNGLSIDTFIFNLNHAVNMVERHGKQLEDLVYFKVKERGTDNIISPLRIQRNESDNSIVLVPGRRDVCECANLLKCPDNTITLTQGSSSSADCVWNGHSILDRASLIPMSVSLEDVVRNESDFKELSSDFKSPINTLLLDSYEIAQFNIDLSALPNNMTYSEHYRIAIYKDCKPCPPLYKCKNSGKCSFPSIENQNQNLNSCLQKFRTDVCVHKNGTVVDTIWCKKRREKIQHHSDEEKLQFNSTFLMYTEPDLHKCLSVPFFCEENHWKKKSFRKLCQDEIGNNTYGPIYDCIEVKRWDQYIIWRESILNHNAELGDDVSDEKYRNIFFTEYGFKPPRMKPKGQLLMDAALQENRMHSKPLSLFNDEEGLDEEKNHITLMKISGCCDCQPQFLPQFFTENKKVSGYPDDKHKLLKFSISTTKRVELTAVLELLHGRYTEYFNSNLISNELKSLYIHRPTRFKAPSTELSTWLSILDKLVIDTIPAELPTNLPKTMIVDDGSTFIEEELFIDQRCEHLLQFDDTTKEIKNDVSWENNLKIYSHSNGNVDFDDDGRITSHTNCFHEGHGLLDRETNNALKWNAEKLRYMEEKKDSSLITLQYLPFFSGCSGFDSHISLSHLIEEHPSCHIVPPNATHPVNQNPWLKQYNPISDICKIDKINELGQITTEGARMMCQFDETVQLASEKYRWFEVESGRVLFEITSHAISNAVFEQMKIENGLLSDIKKVPVRIKSSHGGIHNVIPRRVILELQYYQVDRHTKQLVAAYLYYMDKCTTVKPAYYGGDPKTLQKMEDLGIYPCETDYKGNLKSYTYEMQVLLYPLDWFQLLNKFQFEAQVYIGFYTLAGIASILIGALIWGIAYMSTKLRHPPKFHGWSLIKLTGSPALTGCAMSVLIILINIFLVSLSNSFFQGIESSWKLSGSDKSSIQIYHKGRSGLSLIVIGSYLLFLGAFLVIPTKPNESNKRGGANDNMEDKSIPVNASEQSVYQSSFWKPRLWKRSNFILNAISFQCILLVFWEFSYSTFFKRNIYYVVLALRFIQVLTEIILMKFLREKLLCIPFMVLIIITEILVTMSAADFVSFMLIYFIQISLTVLQKIYLDPFLKHMQILFPKWRFILRDHLGRHQKKSLKQKQEDEDIRKKIDENIELQHDGVEPLINVLTLNSIHMIGRYLSPFAFILISLLYDFSEIAKKYEIDKTELHYYVIFAFNMIPWSTLGDAFVLNAQELLYGWRLYDYLEYQRHRFYSRDNQWTLNSPTFDESIAVTLQSMDSMSFSSQYFFLISLISSGMLLNVVGMTTSLRCKDYNPLGDPATPLIIVAIFLSCQFLRVFMMKVGMMKIDYFDWQGIWGVTQLQGTLDDIVAAKLSIGEGRHVDLERERMELQALNDDKFRQRFLDRNRPWILQHLFDLFTSKTKDDAKSVDHLFSLEHAKDLYKQILKSDDLNNKSLEFIDISSDDDDESQDNNFLSVWDSLSYKGSTLEIMKVWLNLARTRQNFSKSIDNVIKDNIKVLCSNCRRHRSQCDSMNSYLAKNGKRNSSVLDELISKFHDEYGSKRNDPIMWRSFFRQNAEIITLCNFCIAHNIIDAENNNKMKGIPTRPGDISSDEEDEDNNILNAYTPVLVERDSAHGRLLKKWLKAARYQIGGQFPHPDAKSFAEKYILQMTREKSRQESILSSTIDKSIQERTRCADSFDKVKVDKTNKLMMREWLRLAQQNLGSNE